jgi:hypothetical protein
MGCINPVASGFLDAQEELHAIQNSIQKQITKTLELGRLPTAEDLGRRLLRPRLRLPSLKRPRLVLKISTRA